MDDQMPGLIGRLKKSPKVKKAVSRGKSLLFLFLNGIMPAIDVLSDVFTFTELLDSNNPKWAATTLTAILLPFAAKTGMFLKDCFQGKATLENLVSLFLHFPLVSPLIFITLGLYLLTLDSSKAKHSATIETINKIAGLGSLYESFFESGPQLLVQLNIVGCTGRTSKTQLFSMCSSIITLSVTSARAFFIQRDVIHAEPAPSGYMLLMTVPSTFTMVISSASQWAYVTNVKELIFPAFIGTAIFTWLALWAYKKILNIKARGRNVEDVELSEVTAAKEGPKDTSSELHPRRSLIRGLSVTEVVTEQPRSRPREEPVQEERRPISLKKTCGAFCNCVCSFNMFCLLPCTLSFCPCTEMRVPDVVTKFKDKFKPSFNDYSSEVTNLFLQPVQGEDNRFFGIKASLTALLVPCVVGHRESPHTFLVAALASLFIRLLAVILTATTQTHLPPYFKKRTSLFFCTSEIVLASLNMTPSCVSLDCFHFCSSTDQINNSSDDCFTQRFRQCAEEDDYVWDFIIYSLIAATTVLSVMSSYQLHRLSDYTTLYEASKKGFWSWFFTPIVHRTLLFSSIREVNVEKLQALTERADLTRQDHLGYSPVHMAIHCAHKDDARRCLSRLLSVGASPEADSKGHPLHTALENEDYDSVTVLLASQVKVLPSFDGLFPSNCHGDSHAAFEDGLSRLVCLTKEGREELVVNLFLRQQEDFPADYKRNNSGVHHLVYRHSELACCLKATHKKSVLGLFEPSLPFANFTPKEGEALKGKLADLNIVAEDEKFWFDDKQLDAEAWSDQQLYLTHGQVTGLQVEIDDKHNCITDIRCRFGSGENWGDWRTTAPGAGRVNKKEPAFILGQDDAIVGVTTRTDGNGFLAGLMLKTLLKREQSYGTEDDTNRTRVNTVTSTPLLYLSGKKADKRPEKYQLTFHWKASASCTSAKPRANTIQRQEQAMRMDKIIKGMSWGNEAEGGEHGGDMAGGEDAVNVFVQAVFQ